MKKLLIILAATFLPTLLIWLPFFLRIKSFWGIPLPQAGMATIVANYDGPVHLLIAKTLYNQEAIKANFQFPLPLEYYAAHFPLFPFIIRIFSVVLGYPYAMLTLTLLSSFLAVYFFNKIVQKYVGDKNALFLTIVFSVFPARWLIVRSIGSSEPLFIATIIACLYFFQQKKYLSAGIWGGIAQLTKPPGILLFPALLAAYFAPNVASFFSHTKKPDELPKARHIWPILLIPLSLLAVFLLYRIQFKDFFAYFHSGDNIHLFFPPFSVFNFSSPWVGTFWLEEIIFVYLFGILGLVRLIKQKRVVLASFTGIFFFLTLFISHRDLIRYSLPILPCLLIAYSDVLTSKQFRLALGILIIPIYLFSLAYISQNVMPVSNWAPFL